MQRELEHLSNMPSILQRADYEDCLIAFYFGRGKDKLALCRRRAYGDFKRTLHGIGTDVYPRAEKVLGQRLASIKNMEAPSQDQFDAWHRDTCVALAQCGYPFSVGQAQKWINMTFKYVYVMGEQRLPGFRHLYDLCHVPLDTILMDALRQYDFAPLPCAWSKLSDYDVYLERQRWVRRRFPLSPLDVEFCLWLGRPLPAAEQISNQRG